MCPDDAALRALESIPGFPALVKKFLQIGLEQMQYGINMASTIRLSPTQLPDLYKHLPPICKRLGIAEPEFYLEMNPQPNAWTFGDTKIYRDSHLQSFNGTLVNRYIKIANAAYTSIHLQRALLPSLAIDVLPHALCAIVILGASQSQKIIEAAVSRIGRVSSRQITSRI